MEQLTEIKLTPKQKEIIGEMRVNPNVLKWINLVTRFEFKGKTVMYKTVCDLRKKGLIQSDKATRTLGSYYFQLTELGKTIEL